MEVSPLDLILKDIPYPEKVPQDLEAILDRQVIRDLKVQKVTVGKMVHQVLQVFQDLLVMFL